MARLDRATRHLERRAASLASKHVKPEHVDGALKSLARGLQRVFPKDEDLAKIDPNDLDNETIAAHMQQHASHHPRRVAEAPKVIERAPLDSGIGRHPTEQLAHRQDALIAARNGTERK